MDSEERIEQMEADKKALNRQIRAEKERFRKIALTPATQLEMVFEE